jgi:hypothetical protein
MDLPAFAEQSSEPDERVRPVAVSYIEKTYQGDQIVSYSLSSQQEYDTIPVVDKTFLRGPAALDDENNLYLVYGSRENYVSKLSLDGKVQTIELPYRWRLQMVWAGDNLFILPSSSDDSMSIVDTDLNMETISPAINRLDDGTFARGTLGVPDPTENTVIWVLNQPLTDETGDYALYRTISLESLEVYEQKVKIPNANWRWYEADAPTPKPGEKLYTIIHGVDLQHKNVLLCSEYKGEASTLEIYSSQDEQIIASMEYCCMREEIFVLRGETIVENHTSTESCGGTRTINLSDLQPSFNLDTYISPYDSSGHESVPDPTSYWLGSNGEYWLVLFESEVIVINENGEYEASYPLPSTSPIDWRQSGSTLALAFCLAH